MSLMNYSNGEASFRSRILAHRGFWLEASEKNSTSAFIRALIHGFGIETDLRDLDGELVISHDPPKSGEKPISFATFLEIYKSVGTNGWLALNIKADGLSGLVGEYLVKYGIINAFVFDMSVPDMRHYTNSRTKVFTRLSDLEPIACCIDQCAGVWLDSFEEPYVKSSVINMTSQKGHFAAIVSPELHKRGYQEAWTDWASSCNFSENGRLMLCTDFPSKALEYFGESNG